MKTSACRCFRTSAARAHAFKACVSYNTKVLPVFDNVTNKDREGVAFWRRFCYSDALTRGGAAR